MPSLKQIAERLAACPANAWLGLIPTSIEPDGITFAIPVRAEMAGSPVTGAMHGGMTAALVDTLCSFAWLAHNEGRVSTVDMRVDFHSPILGKALIGTGRLVRTGRRIVTADARIFDETKVLLASGRAVMVPFPSETHP